MEKRALYTLSEASRLLGVSRQTIADGVRLLQIPTYPYPGNGKAKGIDQEGLDRLRAWIESAEVLVAS